MSMGKTAEDAIMFQSEMSLDEMKACLSNAYDDPIFKSCLPQPYKTQDIEQFELTHQLVLPPLLTFYLTHISRAFIVTDKLEVFELETWEKAIEEDIKQEMDLMNFPFEYDKSIDETFVDLDHDKIRKMEHHGLSWDVVSDFDFNLPYEKYNKWKTIGMGDFGYLFGVYLPVHPCKIAANVLIETGRGDETTILPLVQFLLGYTKNTSISEIKNDGKQGTNLIEAKKKLKSNRTEIN